MDWSIGIRLGFNTVEIAAQSDGAPVFKRYFKSLTAPEQCLTQLIGDYSISSIRRVKIIGQIPIEALEYRLGGSFAVLTTLGFENWLYLSTPLEADHLSVYSRRPSSFIDKNMIFGVDERTMASGEVAKPITETDLDFLVAKLQMHSINKVALCFLHSDKNPKNENVAASFLRKHGIEVFMSSDADKADEKGRFWTAVMNAYTKSYVTERLEAIQNIFAPLMADKQNIFIGPHRIVDVTEGRVSPMSTAFLKTDLLAENFASHTPLAYFGTESFLLFDDKAEVEDIWQSKWGKVFCPHKKYTKLPIQPLSALERGPYGTLTVQKKELRYDPGPVLFGRGLQPCFLDLLGFRNGLTKVSGFSDRLSEKGQSRMKEQLDTYCREMAMPITGRDHADTLCEALLTVASQRIALSILRNYGTKPVRAAGALAPLIVPLLQKNCPFLQIEAWNDEFFATASLLENKKHAGGSK